MSSAPTGRRADLDLCRAPATLLVLLMHTNLAVVHVAGQAEHVAGTGGYAAVSLFLSNCLGEGANPLFFFISGFLLRGSVQRSGHAKVARSRVPSLVVPMILWNVVVFAGLSAVALLAPRSGLVHNEVSFEPGRIVQALFGVGGSPIVYPTWFLRDVFLLTLLVPLLLRLGERLAWAALAVFGGLFLLQPFGPFIGGSLSFLGLFSLSLGFLAPERAFDAVKARALWVALLWLGFTVARFSPGGDALAENTVFRGLHNLLAGAFLFTQVPRLAEKLGGARLLLTLAPATMFVYLTHEPILTLARKLTITRFRAFGDPGLIAGYLLLPVAVFAGCLLIKSMLRRFLPAVHTVLVGGRA